MAAAVAAGQHAAPDNNVTAASDTRRSGPQSAAYFKCRNTGTKRHSGSIPVLACKIGMRHFNARPVRPIRANR
ncbi:hypothetical protein GCM10009077_31920 [Roseibium denhamense]